MPSRWWISDLLPETIEGPDVVYKEALEAMRELCENRGDPCPDGLTDTLTRIESSGPLHALLQLPAEDQQSYVRVTIRQIAAYAHFYHTWLEEGDDTPVLMAWKSLEEWQQAEYYLLEDVDPMEYLLHSREFSSLARQAQQPLGALLDVPTADPAPALPTQRTLRWRSDALKRRRVEGRSDME